MEALASGIVDAESLIEELHACIPVGKGRIVRVSIGMNLDYFDPKAYTETKMEMYTDAYRVEVWEGGGFASH